MIKAVLFDLDGVLVDATEWHYSALNRALAVFGYTITRYEHLSAYNGLPTRKKLEMLSLEKGLPSALHPLLGRLKQAYTREEILQHCRPSFEKEFMIKRLRRDGYRLAVCSNAVRESVELMVKLSGLYDDFEFLISNQDITKPKPDPETYLVAFTRMELAPEEVVIVEDAFPGVEAGRRSGAYVCEVSGFDEVDYYRVKSFIDSVEKTGEQKRA